MKFKEKPEDFYIEEIIDKKLIKMKGNYSVFKIKKINITTHEAIWKISKYFNLPQNMIGFCGLKDKKSISVQYISLPSNIKENFDFGNLKGFFVGYARSALSPAFIKKNFFNIILKDIFLKEKICERLEEIKIYGLPNYFDHQRFEHAIKYRRFIFEEILKGNYEEALRIYFLTLEEIGRKRLRKFKKVVKRYFGEWKRLLKYAEQDEEREVLFYLLKKGSPRDAIFKIPEYKLKFYAESYQSFLWNKALYRFLKNLDLKGYRARHKLNPFFFYLTLDEKTKFKLLEKNFPLPYPDWEDGDRDFLKIVKELREFKNLKNCGEFKKYLIKVKRSGIFIPEDLKYELENNTLFLSFYLPPGSYATLFLKSLIAYEKIFNHNHKKQNK